MGRTRARDRGVGTIAFFISCKGVARKLHKRMEAIETEVYRTEAFDQWLAGLRDLKAVAKITARIDRLQLGNPGDAAPVGDGVVELRIHYGPGYRVYFVRHGHILVVLLCGGTKATQDGDIKIAKEMAAEVKDQLNGS